MEDILKTILKDQSYDLHEVIPTCPSRNKILFHDKAQSEQYWVKPYNITDFQFLKLSYSEQEDIVETENERCRNGVWFYNFGEPTYLTGDAYSFLTYYKMEGHIVPEFMKFQIATFYFYLYAEMQPSIYGTVELKPRREGCTHRKLSIALNRAIMNESFFVGIQSKTGDDAEKMNFDNVVRAYNKLPCWRKPKSKLNNPSKELAFEEPPKRPTNKIKTLADIEYEEFYLNSKIDWKATSSDAYDGKKLHIYICDEFWKWQEDNAELALKTHKKCVTDGEDIIGIMYVLSTVGIDEKEETVSEEAFDTGLSIWNKSNPHEKNSLGETESGFLRFFISTFKSRRGKSRISNTQLLDKYGNVDEAEAKKLWNVKYETCKTDNERTTLIRQEPPTVQQAIASFRSGGNTFNNTARFSKRLAYLQNFDSSTELGRPVKYWQGNLAWENNERFTNVVRVTLENPENGRFRIPYLPEVFGEGLTNRVKHTSTNSYLPFSDSQFCLGADPFNYSKTVSGTGSKGGFHIKHKYLNRYCLHYRERPASPDLFNEDVLMAAWYFGARVNPERSGSNIFDWFKRNGVYGFIMPRPDVTKNSAFTKGDTEKGTTPSPENVELGCNLIDNTFSLPNEEENENAVDNLEYFWDEITLEQLISFDKKNREKFDAVMAMIHTEIGAQSMKKHSLNPVVMEKETGVSVLDILIPSYRYSKNGEPTAIVRSKQQVRR